MASSDAAIDLRSEEESPVEVEVMDLMSESGKSSDGSIVDLTLPRTPVRRPRRRRRVQHAGQPKNWERHNLDAGVASDRGPAFVYVLQNATGSVYTGEWTKPLRMPKTSTAHAIAAQHNVGTRASTKNKGPWTVKCLVGPFMSRTAALKFERLVKARGRAAGLDSKIKAARHALLRADPPRRRLRREHRGTLSRQ